VGYTEEQGVLLGTVGTDGTLGTMRSFGCAQDDKGGCARDDKGGTKGELGICWVHFDGGFRVDNRFSISG